VSGAPEEPRIACTWCGLFSSPGFCESCGSPLSTASFSVEVSDQASLPPPATPVSSSPADNFLPAENGPLPVPVPIPAVGPPEGIADPAEIFALVEDPAPLVDGPTEPEPSEPAESLESPQEPHRLVEPPSRVSESAPTDEVEVLALESETASISTQLLNPVDQKPDLPSDEGPKVETSQGPSCPSCGRAGGGGLCETCREAIRELSAPSQ